MDTNHLSKPKGLFPAQVVTLSELISYQGGTIVSREILKKQSGNVTIFAIDEGQGLSEHTSPYDAIVQVLEGQAEIMVMAEPHLVEAGKMILLPANQPHAVRATKPFKMVLTMIKS